MEEGRVGGREKEREGGREGGREGWRDRERERRGQGQRQRQRCVGACARACARCVRVHCHSLVPSRSLGRSHTPGNVPPSSPLPSSRSAPFPTTSRALLLSRLRPRFRDSASVPAPVPAQAAVHGRRGGGLPLRPGLLRVLHRHSRSQPAPTRPPPTPPSLYGASSHPSRRRCGSHAHAGSSSRSLILECEREGVREREGGGAGGREGGRKGWR